MQTQRLEQFDTSGLSKWSTRDGMTHFYQVGRVTFRVNSWCNSTLKWPRFSRWTNGFAISWLNVRIDVRTRRF